MNLPVDKSEPTFLVCQLALQVAILSPMPGCLLLTWHFNLLGDQGRRVQFSNYLQLKLGHHCQGPGRLNGSAEAGQWGTHQKHLCLADPAEETRSNHISWTGSHQLDWLTSTLSPGLSSLQSAADSWVVSVSQVEVCGDKYRLEHKLKIGSLRGNLTFGTFRPTVQVTGEGMESQDLGKEKSHSWEQTCGETWAVLIWNPLT